MSRIEEIEHLRARIAKLEARLEIDHAFRLPEPGEQGDDITGLVRFEIPEDERDTMTDKVTCIEIENAHLEGIIRDIYYAVKDDTAIPPTLLEAARFYAWKADRRKAPQD